MKITLFLVDFNIIHLIRPQVFEWFIWHIFSLLIVMSLKSYLLKKVVKFHY